MKVSVIIAAYNIEDYIERCIASIIEQTLKDIEIIVVDDGSDDKTLEYIGNIAKVDNRITVIEQENKGVVEARNTGLSIATGEYILFVDGDDWLEKNALESLYNKAIEENFEIVLYNGYICFDDYKKELDTYIECDDLTKDPIKNMLIGNINPTIWSKFIKRECIQNNNIKIPNELRYGEDLAIVFLLFMNNRKVTCLNSRLYNYYQRSNSVTNVVSDKVFDIHKSILFINEKMKLNNLLDKYSKEFDCMVYSNLFLYGFMRTNNLYKEIHIELYKQFNEFNIDTKNNEYIKINFKKCSLLTKIKVKTYLKSYRLGYLIDNIINIMKRYINTNKNKIANLV